MDNESHEPKISPPLGQSPASAEDSRAVATHLEDSFFETRRLRHDGWDGPKKANFCRTLAETGVVTEACRACDMSAKSAYALRQRDALFGQAWEAALSMARERLADELLARSLKGSVEQIINSNGAIIGERHAYDNKLAFAVLRRLDRRTELGATFKTPPVWAIPDAPAAVSGDWQLLLDAISEDRTADAAVLLTPIPPPSAKGNEGNDPPCEGVDGDSDSLDDDPPYVRKRVYQHWDTDEWRTDFPPPPGFDGTEHGEWDEYGYWRTLTAGEMAALVAAGIAEAEPEPVTIDEDEAARDAFFAALASPSTAAGEEEAKDGGGALNE